MTETDYAKLTLKDVHSSLLKGVRVASESWKASAASNAMDAVRDPDNKELMARARETLAKDDACGKLYEHIVYQINEAFAMLSEMERAKAKK